VLNHTAEDAAEGWYSVALAKSKGSISISSRVLKVAKGDQLSLSLVIFSLVLCES